MTTIFQENFVLWRVSWPSSLCLEILINFIIITMTAIYCHFCSYFYYYPYLSWVISFNQQRFDISL